MQQPTIGFIGLGLMGQGFLKRLHETGHDVIGLDVVAEKCNAARALGVSIAANPAELAEQADIIQICVTTPANVAEIIEAEQGILHAASARANVIVDHSTTDIATTKRLADSLSQQASISFVDAPVSGGPTAAADGSLAIMAGGDDQAIATIRPVMEHLGRFTHMGPVTAGQATKLVNQTLVLTNYCVIAEALRLAEAYGVDAQKIPEALSTGHAGSNLLPVLFDRMIARDWTPLGYARQVLKDLEMLNAAACREHVAMPMSAQALSLFRILVAQGNGEIDGSAVFTVLGDDK